MSNKDRVLVVALIVGTCLFARSCTMSGVQEAAKKQEEMAKKERDAAWVRSVQTGKMTYP